MKNKSIYRRLWAAIGLVVFVLTGCMDDTFVEPGRAVVDENGMVHLRVNTNVPGLKLTRAVDINGEAINTLWLLAFNEDGYMISRVLAQQTNNVQGTEGGTGTFTAEVPASTRRLHFLANVNMDNFSDRDNIGRHENEVIAPMVSSSGNLVYWGYKLFDDETALTSFAAGNAGAVTLYRNQALVRYEVQNPDITVLGWAVCNQYAYGTVAPFDTQVDNMLDGTPFHFDLGTYDFTTALPETYNVKMGDDDDVGQASSEAGDPRYIFETTNPEDDQVYVIMKISKNGGNEFYYKVMLVNDAKEPYEIIRNHEYRITINDVNTAYGVGTFEAAKTATPANNPWITVSDEIPEVSSGDRTLRIEGETTVLYQQAGEQTISFYYNGTTQPDVTWVSNEGVTDGSAPTVTWDSGTGQGTITLTVNAPASGQLLRGTLQVKEADGVLSRRVQIITSEPFEFSPVWVSSEIPLLDGENIAVLFYIPDDFPQELLPVEVKFGCDLIDAQTNESLAVVMEANEYNVPVWNGSTQSWPYQDVTKDWNYKYVYTADHVGQHRVNFRTILTQQGHTNEEEFHIYMEGDDPNTGNDLFRHRDLYFAFQPSNYSQRILLTDGNEATKYATDTISNLNPVIDEEVNIHFTLGEYNENALGDGITEITPTGEGSTILVYYDPAVLSPDWPGATQETDMYGNTYAAYTATQSTNTVTLTSISPVFDSYVVLSAKSTDGYPTNRGYQGVNSRQNAFRSASVTVETGGRLDFSPALSTDGNSFTTVPDGGSFSIPYGEGQDVWLRISIPQAAQRQAFTFLVESQYLTPADGTGWTQSGTTWSYTVAASSGDTQTFHFTTNRLASSETIRLSAGNEVGFNPVAVDITNTPLTGTIQLPTDETFQVDNPYVILERASDGTRIGTFDLIGNPNGQSSARYTLTLRGEYNLNATDRVTVRWMRVWDNTEFSHSYLLEDIMQDDTTIPLKMTQ